MKISTLPAFLFLTIILASCDPYKLKKSGVYKDKATVEAYTNSNKTVAYIPMRHIGTKAFYLDVTKKVDSLEAEGFIVFVESVSTESSNLTEAHQDTIKLKMRWIWGSNISKMGYLDTVNGTFMGKRFNNKKGLINQPGYRTLGVDSLTYKWVDVPSDLLIKLYERKYGKIVLSNCDYKTKLEDRYNCHKETNDRIIYVVLTCRDINLATTILNEKHNKIAVVYGAAHESGMFSELKAIDPKWKKLEKPLK